MGSDAATARVLLRCEYDWLGRRPKSRVEVRAAYVKSVDLACDRVAQSLGDGSDGDKAAVLSHAAEFELNDPAARASFFAAVNTIGSDGDRASVLSNVLRKPNLAPQTAVAAIESRRRLWLRTGIRRRCFCSRRNGTRPIQRCGTAVEKALKSVAVRRRLSSREHGTAQADDLTSNLVSRPCKRGSLRAEVQAD